METNETNPEETQGTTPLVENQTPTEESELVKTPDESSVPYSRFQEVVGDKNEFKTENERLKEELETLKAKEPEEEPADWQEAEKRTVGKATAQMRSELKAEAEKNRAEEREIEKCFSQLKQMGQDVSDDTKKAVLEKMIETGGDVYGTYLEIKGTLDGQAKTEQIKAEGQIPSSQKGSEANTGRMSYERLRKTSLDDMME